MMNRQAMKPALLPPEIKNVQESMSSTRFILPKRALDGIHHLGWVPLVFGSIITLFMVFWMSGPISAGLKSNGIGSLICIGMGLMGIPGLLAGFGLMMLGIIILNNLAHTEIVLGNGEFISIECVGLMRISRRRLITRIRRLVVSVGTGVAVANGNKTRKVPGLESMAVIFVETDDGRQLWVAPGYPVELLKPLADVLGKALALETNVEDGASSLPVLIREMNNPPPTTELPVRKPSNTAITFIDQSDGFAMKVPPAGVWKGSKGLLFFSLVWNCFMAFFTYFTIVKTGPGDRLLGFVLFDAAFIAIGIGLFLGAINMGRRRIILAVAGTTLGYRSTGIFRTVERTIPVNDITAIATGPSNMSVNDQPLPEVQIHYGGGKLGLLREHSEEEQSWVAYVLRQKLNKPGSVF